MKFAIVQNGSITEQGTAAELWPNTSFIGEPDEEFLASKNAQKARNTRNHNAETEILARVPLYIDNGIVYEVEVQPKPAEEPVSDWSGFTSALIASAEFEAIFGAALTSHPLRSTAVMNALQYAENDNTGRFIALWNLWKEVANIPAEVLISFKALATSFNIPSVIVDAL